MSKAATNKALHLIALLFASATLLVSGCLSSRPGVEISQATPEYTATQIVETSEATPEPKEIVIECRLEGCRSSLTVNLSGVAPNDFTLEAIDTTGKKLRVHCVNGTAEDEHSGWCSKQSSTASLYFFPHDTTPPEVTVTVSWDSRSVTRSFKPEYVLFTPNGPRCPPKCRLGKITFDLSE
jgi:hypothetical protein